MKNTIKNIYCVDDLILLMKAIEFAAEKHIFHRRKGKPRDILDQKKRSRGIDEFSTPYINHPIKVANLILNVGSEFDIETLSAAIMHDTIEDTKTTYSEIEREFGKIIADLVQEVTDDRSKRKAERKRLQIEQAPYKSRSAKLIKISDKICNVIDVTDCPPNEWSPERQLEYIEWAKAVVDGMRETNASLESMFDDVYNKCKMNIIKSAT